MKKGKAAVLVTVAFLSILLYAYGTLVYVYGYRTSTIDQNRSGDGRYVVVLESVGRQDSPKGAKGRLVLGDRRHVIVRQDFTLSYDSGRVRPGIWEVTWLKEGALVVINGAEQGSRSYLLGFDGTASVERLEPENSEFPDEIEEFEGPGDSQGGNSDDQTEEGQSTEEQFKEKMELVEKEMRAVAAYLRTEGALSKASESDTIDLTVTCMLDAKGWPYAVVYQEETEFDGVKGRKVQTITYDYMKEYEGQDEFVYEENYYDENGNSVKDTQILDFFLVDHETLAVTDEHTTQWH